MEHTRVPPQGSSGDEVANELPFEPKAMSAFAGDPQLGGEAQFAPEPQFAGGAQFVGSSPYDDAPAPDLIGDLTSQMDRTPQRRLEQMVDYDEDQAVAILKQWLRGGAQA